MRNAFLGLIVMAVSTIACNTAPTTTPVIIKDTVEKTPEPTPGEASKGDNLVKAEAPDALTKTEQGYALPYNNNEKLAQSPINILTNNTLKDNSPFISVTFKTGVTAVENLGHTIQVDFKEGSTTTANGKVYSCKQFHFHTPSEHLIDGITYPMEMHIVSVLKDSNEKTNPQYMVMGFLFKMGRENKFINEFLKGIPTEEKKDSVAPGTVNFDDLFKTIPKNEPKGYYSYKGSLTTSPYSESVSWILKKSILEASPEQIAAIEKLEGDNARHVQGVYTRKVLSQ